MRIHGRRSAMASLVLLTLAASLSTPAGAMQARTDQGVQPGSTMHYWQYCPWGVVMGYYDGNTVTALWNYALHFAMDDNAHGTTFGPSTVGALNLVAGDTAGAVCAPYARQLGIH